MPNRAIHSDIKVVSLLLPKVVKQDSDAAVAALDTRGADAAEVVLHVGAAGDTLSGSVKFEVKAQESDNGTDWLPCAAGDVDVSANAAGVDAPDSNGIICTIDADAEASRTVRAGYKGGKRYFRLFPDATGSMSNGTPISCVGILALTHQKPLADG